MIESKFRGVHTALITPFTSTGAVDVGAMKRLIEYQIDSGIDGLVPCGTTGESSTLTHDEHDRVVELTVKFARGRVPVIAGTGSNATVEAIQLSQHAEQSGADAILLVNPYYVRPTQKGLYLHFKAVVEAVSIPCILYNIQSRTGVNLETETLVRLMNDFDHIIGVKEASGNLAQMKDVIQKKHDRFLVLSGDDNMTIDLIEAGGSGVISVAANIVPGHMKEMVHYALNGNLEQARKKEAQLMPLFKACFVETNPIPIKTAMAMKGWCEEVLRLPMCTLSREEHYDVIRNALAGLDIPSP
ncbi:MAG TPA: 4-hydroxy-tetrahydrodipicolinate synthase [Candidatus Limnocylindrales bacterium]|nr:4-hydroxy-tetrahydrodipicolinate synthase [Candidatus Limnocylindrales bacterium]